MGVCCNKSENKNKFDKKELDSLTLNQNTNSQNTGVKGINNFPITLDQVNKSIDQWKRHVKGKKPLRNQSEKASEKLSEEKVFIDQEEDIQNCLNGLNEINCEAGVDLEGNRIPKGNPHVNISGHCVEIDNSNNEINQDFININKRNNRGFSDISSTIHFTALNSKDLVSSKFNKLHTHNHNNGNSIKSQSIVNVLDELNNNNNFGQILQKESGNNMNFNNLNTNKERNKIFIRNNIFSTKNEVKEISLSILEKSKMTIKKKGETGTLTINGQNNNLTNNFGNNISLNQQVNSYFLVNRTHENQINTIEEDVSKNNNDATIHSGSIQTNFEFYQENVFYHVDKINFPPGGESEGMSSNENRLRLSSVVNGVTLGPWIKEVHEKSKHYQRKMVSSVHNSPEEIDGLKVEWKRLLNIYQNYLSFPKSHEGLQIKQGLSNNCSLIAAIISISTIDKRFNQNLLSNLVFPQIKEKDSSNMLNKNGYYGVKLYFNGCWRYFEIDDYVPVLKNNNKDRNILSKTNDLSINLIEKAIVNLYNGNNPTSFTIKSNPAYEMHHLTGWMPEVTLFDDISNKENLWQRFYSNFTEGNIIICIGTGVLQDAIFLDGNYISTSTSLIQEHSYSVLDFLEVSERRLMKCRNPWGHTIPSINFDIRTVMNDYSDSEIAKEEENGIFWIEWNHVLVNFSYIFLVWNPAIYPCKYSFNSSWKNQKSISKFHDEGFSLEDNPQYVITIPEHQEDFEIRILLTKLISNLENSSKRRQTISFKLFWYEGFPIVYPIDHLRTLKNTYREVNTDVFILEASNQVEQYAIVILKNETGELEEEIGYALDIFSFKEIDVKRIPKREVISNKTFKFVDYWKEGGKFTSPNFIYNPQYKLELTSPSHLQFKLETAVASNVMLSLIENGKHVSQIPYDYIISNKNPGFFFNSFSYFESFLEAGDYNLVCVSQDDKQIGKYTLEVNAIRNPRCVSSDVKVEKMKFVDHFPHFEILRGGWDHQNNKGLCVNNIFAMIKNPGFIFFPHQKAKLKFVLKSSLSKKMNSSLAISDFPSMGVLLYKFENNPNQIQSLPSFNLIMDGSSTICSGFGFYSDEIEIDPIGSNSGYMALCVNLSKNQFSKFDLEIFSSSRLSNFIPNTNFLTRRKTFTIFGKWDKNNSGGGVIEPTFNSNSHYEVIPSKTTMAYLELSSQDNHYISFLFTECKSLNILQDVQESRNAFNQNEYVQGVCCKLLILEQGKKYILIPFTRYPNNVGYFDFILSTDDEISVKEIFNKVN